MQKILFGLFFLGTLPSFALEGLENYEGDYGAYKYCSMNVSVDGTELITTAIHDPPGWNDGSSGTCGTAGETDFYHCNEEKGRCVKTDDENEILRLLPDGNILRQHDKNDWTIKYFKVY